MFSYDLDTYVGQVRLHLGDNTEDSGVLPSGKNFTDEEIRYFYSKSMSDLGYTLVTMCRSLASTWSSVPENFNADGLIVKVNDAAAKWNKMADTFAKDYRVWERFGIAGFRTIGLRRTDAGDD